MALRLRTVGLEEMTHPVGELVDLTVGVVDPVHREQEVVRDLVGHGLEDGGLVHLRIGPGEGIGGLVGCCISHRAGPLHAGANCVVSHIVT